MSFRSRLFALLPFAVSALLFVAFLAVYWTYTMSAERTGTEERAIGQPPAALRLSVAESGITAIDGEALAQLGLPDLSVETLSLSVNGEPVPFLMRGSGPDATLIFYAHVSQSSAAPSVVYWLAAGKGNSMTRHDAPPGEDSVSVGFRSQRWEDNSTFLAQAQGDDNWLGPLLFAPATLEQPLDGITPNGGPGHLTVRLWSNNQAPENPDHHVRLSLNGQQLLDHTWDGIRQETLEVVVPSGLLQAEGNQLLIEVPGDTGAAGEAIYLDWISLDYASELDARGGQLLFESDAPSIRVAEVGGEAIVLDVTKPEQPVLLEAIRFEGSAAAFTGRANRARYAVAMSDQFLQTVVELAPFWDPPLRSGERGADYLAIVADQPGFHQALQPLLDHRSQQGLRVTAIPLQQIYDEFGHGRPTPEAIRDFLAYASESWQPPAPRFLLLAGDASYDPRGFTDGANVDLLPTQLVYTEYAGYVASDHWFGLLEDDQAPALAIGRFPAQTAEQLATMVAKTLAYEAGEPGDSYGRALLVADDELAFDRASDDLASVLEAEGYETVKLYMSSQEEIGEQIIQAFNQGAGFVNYVGHGGIEVWADEVVFRAEDASRLHNGDRLPIFTTFTCLNGYFNHPQVDALAETLLWTPNGGIVAAVAPSGRTFTVEQVPLADAFYRELLEGRSATIGEAMLNAKRDADASDNLGDVVETFNLLGDPALRFRPPGGSS